jgi:signal transduction histidine kinase
METLELLITENAALKQELEAYRSNEKLFQALVETAVGDIGEDFFNNIVIKLSEWLNAECVIIGQLVSENLVEGFPAYLDGKLIKGFTYKLKDTPCDLTSKKGFCVYHDRVIDFFPTAKDLLELSIRGYVGTALYNKDGEPNGILCAMSRNELKLPPQTEAILRIVGARISSEIERIKAQKALEVSESNLKKAIHTKDRLYSVISHDLRTPFNALIGFSKLLQTQFNSLTPEKIKKYIGIIYEVSGQTYNLLTNLLDWSLTQTNEIKFNPQKIELKTFIDEVTKSQVHLAEYKDIAFSVSVEDGITVVADANMISAILRNLISNALKFTSHGGKVQLSVKSASNEITFCIADNGCGINPEDIKTLFDHENSFSTSGTDNEKGAGIGLLLCKELVQKHKGKIWAESKTGEGSRFYFSIPVK